MKQNIQYNFSNENVDLTDIPIDILVALRDDIDEAIKQYDENVKNEYLANIIEAINAAQEKGYAVILNGIEVVDSATIILEEETW